MDRRIMKKVFTALLVCAIAFPAIVLPIITVPAMAAEPVDAGPDTLIPPEVRVKDDAYIFTEAEAQVLNAALNAATVESGAHFIIMTTRVDMADEDMEPYAYAYFDSSVRGKGGLDDCVILNINMETRWVEIRCFGELRYMISDYEASVVREALTPDMSEGNYFKAAKIFITEMSSMVKRKYAEYRIDVPEVDPGLRLYDFGGLMSGEERGVISERINDLSDKTRADFIIVTLNENVDEGYLQRYASSFYNLNFKEKTGYSGAYMLVISYYEEIRGSQATVRSNVFVAPFGTHDPENQIIWDDQRVVGEKLGSYGVFTACASFLSRNLDVWQAQNIELPEFDPANYVSDYGNVLSDAQRNDLSELLREQSEKLGTSLYFIITPYSTHDASFAFSWNLWLDVYSQLPENAIFLAVSSPLMVEGDTPTIDMNHKGNRPSNKLGSDARYNLYSTYGEVWMAVSGGDYTDAVWLYADISHRALSSLIPKAVMAEEFLGILEIGVIAAIAIGVVAVLILRIVHGFNTKRKVPARSYFVRNSLSLHFSADRFVSTHTTSVRIDTDSGGSRGGGGGGGFSGGSSGGGHSSGSGGRF